MTRLWRARVLLNRELFDHAVLEMWLFVLRVGDEAEDRVRAGTQIHLDEARSALDETADAADGRSRRRTLRLREPRTQILHRLAGGELDELELVHLRSFIHDLDRVFAGGKRSALDGERVVAERH